MKIIGKYQVQNRRYKAFVDMHKISIILVFSILGVMALSLASCDSDSDSAFSDDSVWKVKKESRLVAEKFLLESPTFNYDGIEDSMEQALAPEAAGPEQWRFLFSFVCENEGYGDEDSREDISGKETYHEALITVANGEITKAVMDNDWDMIDQKQSSDWTWGEAGKQAIYGLLSVFIILILLTILTRIAGIIITRMESRNTINTE